MGLRERRMNFLALTRWAMPHCLNLPLQKKPDLEFGPSTESVSNLKTPGTKEEGGPIQAAVPGTPGRPRVATRHSCAASSNIALFDDVVVRWRIALTSAASSSAPAPGTPVSRAVAGASGSRPS